MGNRLRHRAQEGQALLVVLIVVTLLSLIGAAMAALWAHSVILAQRRADETKALYAAEAGLAEGVARIFSGDSDFLGGHGELSGQVDGSAYHVEVRPAGKGSDTALEIVSTGWPAERPNAVRRTVRLVVDSPFFRPVVAGRDLKLLRRICLISDEVCWEWPFSATFSPSAMYGGGLTAGRYTTGAQRGVMRFPTLSYAALAARVPVSGDPVLVSSGKCEIRMSGWFVISERCSSLTVDAPWVGIMGNVDVRELRVTSRSVLVTTGDVDVSTFFPAQAHAVGGGGVVIAGGKIDIATLDLAAWGNREPIALLALDTNTPDCTSAVPGCTYNPQHADEATDRSNSISISQFSLLASVNTSTHLVAYAAPFRVPPPNGSRPSISVNVGSLVEVGETTFRGALVSDGDVTVADYSGLPLTSFKFEADPPLLGPIFRLAASDPGAGLLTQVSWSEESRHAP